MKYSVDFMGCVEIKVQDHKAERMKNKIGLELKIFTNYPIILNERL